MNEELKDGESPVTEIEIPESEQSEVSEPKPKRAYKQRAPKMAGETLNTNEQPVRKPRQKKGSIENTAKQLEGIHKMVAMLPNLGFMAITDQEARILAEGMQAVAEEYDVQISGKTGAAIQLFSAAAMVYAPRAIYAAQLRKEKKAEAVILAEQNLSQDSPLQ